MQYVCKEGLLVLYNDWSHRQDAVSNAMILSKAHLLYPSANCLKLFNLTLLKSDDAAYLSLLIPELQYVLFF